MKVYKSKIYVSREGLSFSIVKFPKPAIGSVVYFTEKEFEWLKKEKLKPEHFKFLWLAKKDDHNYQMLPDDVLSLGEQLAQKYMPSIRPILEKFEKNAPVKLEQGEIVQLDWNKIWDTHCEHVKATQAIIVSRRGYSGGW